jgi:adenylyltransferase/sulfurtransferase
LGQTCGEAGVIGVLPGIIGTLQANEAIKVITGLGESLSGKLMTFDALSAVTRKLTLSPRARFAAAAAPSDITYSELVSRIESPRPPVLVDVRESSERHAVSIGGDHIPLATLPQRLADLPAEGEIVVYCKSGVRSAKAVLYLRSVLPGAMVRNLKGGVDACVGAGLICPAHDTN